MSSRAEQPHSKPPPYPVSKLAFGSATTAYLPSEWLHSTETQKEQLSPGRVVAVTFTVLSLSHPVAMSPTLLRRKLRLEAERPPDHHPRTSKEPRPVLSWSASNLCSMYASPVGPLSGSFYRPCHCLLRGPAGFPWIERRLCLGL